MEETNTNISKIEDSKELNGSEQKTVFMPTPKQLYAYLNDYVIGQDDAKKTLSIAIYNHFKRFMINVYGAAKDVEAYEQFKDVTIEKANLMMLGDSGTGKTYMIKTICKFLNIPCYIADCNTLSETGYVGDDVENVIVGLLKDCNYNVEQAQCGCVVLDEVDKLSRKGENVSITRDVGGEGVQQNLLKLVEGGVVAVPPNGGRKHPEQQCIDVDTTNILFIALGAFEGIDKIISKRLNTNRIGFKCNDNITTDNSNVNNEKNLLDDVTADDIRKYGIIPELLGRFPIITHTNPLTEEDMIKILTDTKSSVVKQYQKLLSIDNVDLQFTEDAIKEIAKQSLVSKTGARGIKKIMENLLSDIMFEYGGNVKKKKITIDKTYVDEFYKKKKVA